MRHGNRRDEEKVTVKRPDTELTPIWGYVPDEDESERDSEQAERAMVQHLERSRAVYAMRHEEETA